MSRGWTAGLVVAAAAALVVGACSVPEPRPLLAGPISDTPACPHLQEQIARTAFWSLPPRSGSVTDVPDRTAVDVWGRRAAVDIDPVGLARFALTFHDDYEVVAEGRVESIGVDVEVRSDGAPEVDLDALDELVRLVLTTRYPDQRFRLLMLCYQHRFLADGMLEGHRLRIYVPVDRTTCFQGGVLRPRGDGGCDAIGVAIPHLGGGPRLFGARPLSLRWPATVVVAPGHHPSVPETAERRAALTTVHELVHYFDNVVGLLPHPRTLRTYEQRAYYAQDVLRRRAAIGDIDLPEPFVWEPVIVPETVDDERR